MLIQSHPDVGSKCLDIPYGRFVIGMRVQSWDCNNANAQIFSYDAESQELKIGALCVESWGRGIAQDPVGLGTCNRAARQLWKMVQAGNYYQISGVNGLCLNVRGAAKERGAVV